MNHIKIAFFDIDGTLIDMNTKVISDKMEETLIRLKENGVLICVATGRPLKNLPHFPNVDFDVFLTFNGSYCCTRSEVISKTPIPSSDVQTIIENAKRINRPVVVASIDRMGANGKDQDLVEYFAVANQPVTIAEDFEELAKEDIYQMMIGCQKEEYDQILKHADGAAITAWWPRAADIIPANGGKGLGVSKVLDYYQLSKEEAIAFGDGTNDIEMLQAVGLGVAMGNATDDVKAIADDVCGSVAEDGIYEYCEKYHLI